MCIRMVNITQAGMDFLVNNNGLCSRVWAGKKNPVTKGVDMIEG